MSLDSPSAPSINGARFRFAIAAARFNGNLVESLLGRVQAELRAAGVKPTSIQLERVPGSHEIPYAIHALLKKGRFDCAIAVGVLIGGDTNHHEMVGSSVSHALQHISTLTRTPIINGVIVTDNREQAEARASGKINRGSEFARAALEMAALHRKLRS